MERLVLPPHPRLAPFVLHLLAMRLDGCETRLPAALSPSLLLFVRGGTRLRLADGSLRPIPRLSLCGPSLRPRHSLAAPNTLFVSVMFRPGLLDQALGFPVSELGEEIVPMESISGPGAVGRLLDEVDEASGVETCVTALQRFLLGQLVHRPPQGFGAAFLRARHKMFLPVGEIAAHFGVGERQLERRVRHSFGVPLRDLRRMARFGYALARLVTAPVARGDLTRIAHEFGFYDQAHMDREFARFSGMAPSRLLDRVAGEEPGYWVYRLGRHDFEHLFLP